MFTLKRKANPNPKDFHFISWNINGTSNLLEMSKFLKDQPCDFILFQETKFNPTGKTKAQKEKYSNAMGEMRRLQSKLGYSYFECSNSTTRAGYSGTAILSLSKPLKVATKMKDATHAMVGEGRLIVGEYERFCLVNCYVPNAGTNLARLDEKRVFLEELARFLIDFAKGKPFVIGCDMNVCYDLHLDCHSDCKELHGSISGRTPEEKLMMEKFLVSLDLVDTFRQLHPQEKKWTWLDSLNKKKGMRLDYFLVSKSLIEDCTTSDMFPSDTPGSDHIPIFLEMKRLSADEEDENASPESKYLKL